jgi:hypothetical protein
MLIVGTRDDFTSSVKERIARRAGYRCSAPSCRASTPGPTDDPDGASNVGVAAHITAASAGGPRYDPTLTPEQRRGTANGIWLCQNHAKQIDDDVVRFTVQLLRDWKELAEMRAASEQGAANHWTLPMAIPAKKALVEFDGDYDALHETIQIFGEDTGLARVWGAMTEEKIHYLLYELMINAFEHAEAAQVELRSRRFGLELTYQGDRFGIDDLLNNTGGGGGKASLEAVRMEEAGRFELTYRWTRGTSTWGIVDFLRDDGDFFPCSMHWNAPRSSTVLQTCDEVHVYLPERFSMSDSKRLPEEVEDFLCTKQLVVHGAPKWPALRDYLAKRFTNVRFVS